MTKKAYSVGIAKSAAACCTCFSLVIILHIKYLHPLVSKPFCACTLAFFIVVMAFHLQLCSIEDFGKRLYFFLHCYTCAVTQGKKSLFSGNCQVGCCLLHVLQLGYYTPHKIFASSGFKAFLYSTLPSSLLPWCLICNSVRLRILGNVHTLFCIATPVP